MGASRSFPSTVTTNFLQNPSKHLNANRINQANSSRNWELGLSSGSGAGARGNRGAPAPPSAPRPPRTRGPGSSTPSARARGRAGTREPGLGHVRRPGAGPGRPALPAGVRPRPSHPSLRQKAALGASGDAGDPTGTHAKQRRMDPSLGSAEKAGGRK